MKATEITDLIIEYLEADCDTYEDEDGGHVVNEFSFELAEAAVKKKFPNLSVETVDTIFEIVERHVSVIWHKWNEPGGVCFEPEFDIDRRADEEIGSII